MTPRIAITVALSALAVIGLVGWTMVPLGYHDLRALLGLAIVAVGVVAYMIGRIGSDA